MNSKCTFSFGGANLHYTCGIIPKRETSGDGHLKIFRESQNFNLKKFRRKNRRIIKNAFFNVFWSGFELATIGFNYLCALNRF